MRMIMARGCRIVVREFQRRLIGGPSGLLTTSFASVIVLLMFYFNFYGRSDVYIEADSGHPNNVTHDQQPNRTWMQLRKELLEKRGIRSKVVLMSYMRGGTTLFSDIFNLNSQFDVLWHEPLDAFYQWYAGLQPHSVPLSLLYYQNLTRRILSDREKNSITDYLFNLLTCNPQNIPMETFAHYHISYSAALKSISKCMEDRKAKFHITNCTKLLGDLCGHNDIIRRDMSITFGNRCPDIIAAAKSLIHDAHLVSSSSRRPETVSESLSGSKNSGSSDHRQYDLNKKLNRSSRQSDILETLRSVFPGQVGANLSQTKDLIELIYDRQVCLSHLEPLVRDCIQPAYDICRKTKLSALKLIRVMFDDLEDLIQRTPDIHVIHYVRDPRAIATSRSHPEARLTMSNRDQTPVTETRILCRRLAEDLKAKRRLMVKYPGSISTVRYEDFVSRPRKIIADVFQRIDRPIPTGIHDWIKTKFSADGDNGIYGIVRANPLMTSQKWMSATNLATVMEMDQNCHDVLIELGYLTISTGRADYEDGKKDEESSLKVTSV